MEADWEHVQATPEFRELRRRQRRFAFPMTVAFLVWYLLYVLLADYAHAFMSIRLWGSFTMGLLLGLVQFASTFLITWLYSRHARRRLDPLAGQLRAEYDG